MFGTRPCTIRLADSTAAPVSAHDASVLAACSLASETNLPVQADRISRLKMTEMKTSQTHEATRPTAGPELCVILVGLNVKLTPNRR